MILQKLQTKKSEILDTLTLFAGASRVNLLALLDQEEDLKTLEELSWQVLNSKNFSVPQNRERVFIIGHLREGRTRRVFPIIRENAKSDNQQSKIEIVGNTKNPNGRRFKTDGEPMFTFSDNIHNLFRLADNQLKEDVNQIFKESDNIRKKDVMESFISINANISEFQLSQGFASKEMCRHNLVRCIGYLKNLGYDFDECFELAYQEIKDRKGLWIDGSFVKWEELPDGLRAKIK